MKTNKSVKCRQPRSAVLLCVASLLLTGVWAAELRTARAQDDAAPAPIKVRDPLARTLLDTNPTGPSDIVRVLNSLVDLREFDAAAAMLNRLGEAASDEAALAALYDEFGSATFSRLTRQKELQAAATKFVGLMLAAVEKRAHDPEQIRAQIGKLASPALAVRTQAVERLVLGDTVAAQQLLTALVDPEQIRARSGILSALVALDGRAIPVLQAAVVGPDAALAVAAVGVLGALPTSDATMYLLVPAFASDAPAELQAAALRALAERGSPIGTPEAAAGALLTRAVSLDWPAGDFVGARQWAAAALAIRPESAACRNAFLRTTLRLIGNDRAEAMKLLDQGGAKSVSVALELLADALVRTDDLAAVRAVEYLGEHGDVALLAGRGSQPSLLVEACRSSRPMVSVVAVEAIGKIGPTEPFSGSSYVAAAVNHWLSARGARVVVSGDVRTDFARLRAGLLSAEGYDAEIADTARQVLAVATARADCELIVLDMNLAAPTSGQLLGSLRRDARTALVPIVIVSSTDKLDQALALARRYPYVAAVVDVRDASGAAAVVQAAGRVAGQGGLTQDERRLLADRMLAWLDTQFVADDAASSPGSFSVSQFEPAILATLANPKRTAAASRILARCPTVSAQRALAEAVDRKILPLAARQAAAAAFVESIVRHGALLTSAQLSARYDQYNSSVAEPREVQQLYAAVLDAIEARAGRVIENAPAEPAVPSVPVQKSEPVSE